LTDKWDPFKFFPFSFFLLFFPLSSPFSVTRAEKKEKKKKNEKKTKKKKKRRKKKEKDMSCHVHVALSHQRHIGF
jgi:choline-glycine betaine transporter